MVGRTSKYKLLLILASGETTVVRASLLRVCQTSEFISVRFTSLVLTWSWKREQDFLFNKSAN